jgi:Methyl-CpG binding domain
VSIGKKEARKKCDIYYYPPSGKRLRSYREVNDYCMYFFSNTSSDYLVIFFFSFTVDKNTQFNLGNFDFDIPEEDVTIVSPRESEDESEDESKNFP